MQLEPINGFLFNQRQNALYITRHSFSLNSSHPFDRQCLFFFFFFVNLYTFGKIRFFCYLDTLYTFVEWNEFEQRSKGEKKGKGGGGWNGRRVITRARSSNRERNRLGARWCALPPPFTSCVVDACINSQQFAWSTESEPSSKIRSFRSHPTPRTEA